MHIRFPNHLPICAFHTSLVPHRSGDRGQDMFQKWHTLPEWLQLHIAKLCGHAPHISMSSGKVSHVVDAGWRFYRADQLLCTHAGPHWCSRAQVSVLVNTTGSPPRFQMPTLLVSTLVTALTITEKLYALSSCWMTFSQFSQYRDFPQGTPDEPLFGRPVMS